MLMLKIAFRNIFRQKRRTVLTALSMFGGFVLAAFFIGFSDGTYNDIINTFTRNQMGHIQVHHKDYLDRPALYKTIDDLPKIETILSGTPEVESWAPRLYSAGLASVGEKSAGVSIIGIDPAREIQTTRINEKITTGTMFHAGGDGDNNANGNVSGASREVIIGKGLAKLLKADIGDEAVVVSQGADGSIANEAYRIVGILDSGDEISDRMAFYLPMDSARELLVMEGRVHELAITVCSLEDVARTTELLAEKTALVEPDLAVDPWQVFARSFYVAMKADKEGMWVMLVIIILVVAVGVLNTVLMSVLERRREYGVLKAVGTRPGKIIKMVLAEVSILAVICVILGTVVGLFLNYLVSVQGFSLPEPISYGGMDFQHMRAEINARSFYIPAVTVILAAILVSIFPAFKAARTDPARSMRIH